jgi:hypothetical protein
MSVAEVLFILTAVGCGAMAGFVLVRQKGTTVRWWLATGLLLLAGKQLASLWGYGSPVPSRITEGQQLRLLFLALLPGPWLAFSLSYGRVNAGAFLRRWAPALLLGSALPPILVLLPWGQFYQSLPVPLPDVAGGWALPLGTRGYLFHLSLIVAATLILANFERTLRASIGRVRWQIKFALLGLGGYFAVHIYIHAEAVLYRVWTSQKLAFDSWVLLVALVLTAVSLRRSRTLQLDVYLSQSALQRSIALLAVGAYLFGVGVVVHLLQALGLSGEYRQVVVFLAVLAVVVVLLSDRAQQDLKRITLRHFRRPTHDYRRIWTRFSQGTEDKSSEPEVGRSVVAVVAEALDSLSVSLWTWDAGRRAFHPVASTTPTEGLSLEGLAESVEEAGGVVEVSSSGVPGFRGSGVPGFRVPSSESEEGVRSEERPGEEGTGGWGLGTGEPGRASVFGGKGSEERGEGSEERPHADEGTADSARSPNLPPSTLNLQRPAGSSQQAAASSQQPAAASGQHSPTPSPQPPVPSPPSPASARGAPDRKFGTTRIDYLVPLRFKKELVGVLALGDRVRGKPLGYEDRELLEVLADQTAAILTRIRLARRLREASEMEAFQSMSAFFVHDLKNLANRLSLTVQNLPRHYDKPEFREEALRTIGQSVEKIQEMCSRLSPLREKPELRAAAGDLAELARKVAEEMRPQLGDTLVLDLRPVPPVPLDSTQFRKVIVNLVLNAWEAAPTFSGFRVSAVGDGGQRSAGRSEPVVSRQQSAASSPQPPTPQSPAPTPQSPAPNPQPPAVPIRAADCSDDAGGGVVGGARGRGQRVRDVAGIHGGAAVPSLPDDEEAGNGNWTLPVEDDRRGPRRPYGGRVRRGRGHGVSGTAAPGPGGVRVGVLGSQFPVPMYGVPSDGSDKSDPSDRSELGTLNSLF